MSAQQKKHPFDFKTQYGLGLSTQDDEIVVDFFCGGGGAGTGQERGLGRAVNVAKNHSASAINMHTVNHPGAVHYTTDVFDGDPDTECGGKTVGWFYMSPDCTHHSQAASGQPHKREIRNMSWIGVKWVGKKKPRVISLENVKQILQWGALIAKRCKSTGRVVKLGGGVAAPGGYLAAYCNARTLSNIVGQVTNARTPSQQSLPDFFYSAPQRPDNSDACDHDSLLTFEINH